MRPIVPVPAGSQSISQTIVPVDESISVLNLSEPATEKTEIIQAVPIEIPHALIDPLSKKWPTLPKSLEAMRWTINFSMKSPQLSKNGLGEARLTIPAFEVDQGFATDIVIESEKLIDKTWEIEGSVQIKIYPAGSLRFSFRLHARMGDDPTRCESATIDWTGPVAKP